MGLLALLELLDRSYEGLRDAEETMAAASDAVGSARRDLAAAIGARVDLPAKPPTNSARHRFVLAGRVFEIEDGGGRWTVSERHSTPLED